ncbi:hypothetical protein H8356DRAFT_1338726 [Neocallimastix lanati (nom. inval.)]|nr:hypothetical protein H8356DRAFT_1338726 [Neocallimastix sp. JGI-2020a]
MLWSGYYRTMTSSNYTWSNCKAVQQGRDYLLSRKLDKGSSNKPLCVYRCAAEEKSCYGR